VLWPFHCITAICHLTFTRFPAIKELCAITADPLWDKKDEKDEFSWKKVDGTIKIIEKVFTWEGRSNEDWGVMRKPKVSRESREPGQEAGRIVFK
jgi:hypothetical protein